VPETEEYGVASYVYRARSPFDPSAIHALLNSPMPGVIRAKGHFWIATQPDVVAEFSLAGALSSVKPLGTWWASVPMERWPDPESARAYLADRWVEPWGDRRQEIVFIGAGIDWPHLRARLDACLLSQDVAPGPDAFPDLPDPFPVWSRANQAA
jgi:G3E family GTPase